MSKKMKLNLEELKVQSFVTSLNNEVSNCVKAGGLPTDPYAGCANPSQGCSVAGNWCNHTDANCSAVYGCNTRVTACGASNLGACTINTPGDCDIAIR